MADLIAELEGVVREAYRAGFIEACKWPEPVTQDADSPAFDREFRKWNNEVRTHRAEIAAAVRDKRRLDWLDRDCTHVPDEYGMARQLYFGTYSSGQTLREAIDVAMAETGIPVTEQDQPLAAMRAGEGEG